MCATGPEQNLTVPWDEESGPWRSPPTSSSHNLSAQWSLPGHPTPSSHSFEVHSYAKGENREITPMIGKYQGVVRFLSWRGCKAQTTCSFYEPGRGWLREAATARAPRVSECCMGSAPGSTPDTLDKAGRIESFFPSLRFCICKQRRYN